MIFKELELKGAYLIDLEPFKDERGLFARTFCKKEFQTIGLEKAFVQINHSRNRLKGTLRGLHYQKPPFAEIKFIRCIKGAVFDVLVDLRNNSPTFLKFTSVHLSAENMKMVYIPEGFAHGFQTLENDTELIYHHTEFYTPKAEFGLKFDDPEIGIQWPFSPSVLSDKDQNYPFLDHDFTGIKLS